MLIILNVDVNRDGEVVVVYSDPIEDNSKEVTLEVHYSEEALRRKVKIDY